MATFLPAYSAGKYQLIESYWGPDYPDPNDYLVFLPGGSVSLRLNWQAVREPGARGARQEGGIDGLQRPLASSCSCRSSRSSNQSSPFFPLVQPAQAIVGSANLTGLALNPSWLLNVAEVGTK